MIDKVPTESSFDTEVPIIGTLIRSGEDPFDLSLFGAEGNQASATAVRAGGSGLHEFPGSGLVIETVAGDGSHRAGIEALAAKLALERTVKIRINDGPDAPACKGEFSHALDFIADSYTTSAEDAFVPIPLKKRGEFIRWKGDEIPGIEGVLHAVFIDQVLQFTFALFFASWAGHGMVEQNELELNSPGLSDFRRMGENLHPVFSRGETGGQKLFFPFLLNHTEPAGAKGDEPSVIAERGNLDAGDLSRLKDRLSLFNFYWDTIDG
jgi:hypothetical protein